VKISDRPKTLAEVAGVSDSKASFGMNLADFEHELVRHTSRKAIGTTIEAAPPLLRDRFPTGGIADAWLAGYAEELAFRFDLDYPNWLWEQSRFLDQPYIHDARSQRLKLWHMLRSPPGFSRRNLFVDFHLPPVRLRPGRPRKSAEHKRAMNRARVARHRSRTE